MNNDGWEVLRKCLDFLHARSVPQLRRQGCDRLSDRALELMLLNVMIRIEPGTAGEANVLVAFRDVEQVARQGTPRAEEVHLENQCIVREWLIENL